MKTTEIYDTLIDGRKYIFTVTLYDGIWTATARLGTGKVKSVGYAYSSERAALKLVKLLEK